LTIRFRCAQCDQRLRAVEALVGRPVRCPRCEARLRVPAPGGDEPAVEPAPTPASPEPATRSGVSAVRQASLSPSAFSCPDVSAFPGGKVPDGTPPADRIVLNAEDLAEPDGGRPAPGALSLDRADLGLDPDPGRPRFSDGLTHAGKICPFCQSGIAAEDRVAACALCAIPHHLECWHENGGCTTFGCEAAPMPLAEAPAGGWAGARVCPYCSGLVDRATGRCARCGVLLQPTAARPAAANPHADKALAVAFLSIVVPVLVPLAIWFGGRALAYADERAEMEGVRTARTAVILATAAGVLWIAALFGILSAV